MVQTLKIAIQEWIVAGIEKQSMSLRELAIKAGVDPSTLQKFCNQNPDHCLSMSIVEKLGRVLGNYPNLNPSQDFVELDYYEVEENKMVRKGTRRTSAEGFGPNSYKVLVVWNTMNQRGVFPGDVIVVDPDRKPIQGDMVFVKDNETFTLYEYNLPYLLTKSSESYPNLDISLVDVLGTIAMKETWY